MDRTSWFVLALVEEDEFSLWEVEGALRAELGEEGGDVRAQAREAIVRLLNARLVELYEPSGAVRTPSLRAQLATDEAWVVGPHAVGVHATELGRATYRTPVRE